MLLLSPILAGLTGLTGLDEEPLRLSRLIKSKAHKENISKREDSYLSFALVLSSLSIQPFL